MTSTTTCKTCGLVVSSTGGPYCAEHKREAYLEYARLKEARYRARKRLARLKRVLTNQEPGELKDAPATALGTSNLHANPVKDEEGEIDFSEEARRIQAEIRRLKLKKNKYKPPRKRRR